MSPRIRANQLGLYRPRLDSNFFAPAALSIPRLITSAIITILVPTSHVYARNKIKRTRSREIENRRDVQIASRARRAMLTELTELNKFRNFVCESTGSLFVIRALLSIFRAFTVRCFVFAGNARYGASKTRGCTSTSELMYACNMHAECVARSYESCYWRYKVHSGWIA